MLVSLLKNVTDRQDPKTTVNDEINYYLQVANISNKNIFIPWAIIDNFGSILNFTELIIPKIYYFKGSKYQILKPPTNKVKILNYTYCNNKKNSKFNINFNNYYCIDMNDIILGGDLLNNSIYQIQIDFSLCENCSNYDELEKIIGNWHIELYYPTIKFNANNKLNPMEIIYESHFYNLNIYDTKIDRVYLKEFSMIDDQGWFFENIVNMSFWGLDKIDSNIYTNKKNVFRKIYSLYIYLNNNRKIYTRKYIKLFDSIGNILSIVQGIYMMFKYLSQFFTEAYQDRDIVDNIFIQKYFTDEKYNKFKSTKFLFIKNLSSNLEFVVEHNKKNKINESINKNNNISNVSQLMKSSDQMNLLSNKIKNTNQLLPTIKINKLKIYKTKKDNGKVINNNPFNLFKNWNYVKNSSKINRRSNINVYRGSNINSYFDNSVILDGSKMQQKMFTPRVNKSIKNSNRIEQIKNYMQKKKKKGQSSAEFINYKSIDFKFPYYLYLLNIFNKIFASKKVCCVNDKFIDSWEYMINVFDVTQFIRMQTNMDLINKIIFEMKNEEENSKNGVINKENMYNNIFIKNNNEKNRLDPLDNVK